MPIHNAEIAAIFDELADLLEVDGADFYRVRAYRNGARSIHDLPHELSTLLERGEDLVKLPGIGKELAKKIHEILDTGRCTALDRLHRRLPHSLTELLALPGLGPKRVHTLYHELHIHDPKELHHAAAAGELHRLPGFGRKTEEQLLERLEHRVDHPHRMIRAEAEGYVEALLAYLRALPAVERAEAAGSFRRGRETVGDLDLLVQSAEGAQVADAFVAYDEVESVIAHGRRKSSVRLRNGLQVDLRVVSGERFGAALHYFTGNRGHNVALRREAQRRGLKLNEYGVFDGEERIAGSDENEVFAALGYPYIEPELREGRGELEAAHAGLLPQRLVSAEDLKGSLHNHTRWSDGRGTLEEMVEAAVERGHAYIAITDHSQRLTIANGLDSRRLLEQLEAIDRLQERYPQIAILKGSEVDILEDGSMDLPEEVLARLDLVVGAVHTAFELPRAKQTRRILRAMESRYFSILAHPFQRMINERPPLELDIERIIRAARERGCFLELNATPKRLDLDDRYLYMAREAGVMVAIDADAHHPLQLDHLRHGALQARRGWLEPRHVINTRPLDELRALLRTTMG
ncbi:DNA polymerase/3'-5' exonuclease PolX [Endothiovibrio diazotrophicus]